MEIFINTTLLSTIAAKRQDCQLKWDYPKTQSWSSKQNLKIKLNAQTLAD